MQWNKQKYLIIKKKKNFLKGNDMDMIMSREFLFLIIN